MDEERRLASAEQEQARIFICYEIKSPRCGRSADGTFHCYCGRCVLSIIHVGFERRMSCTLTIEDARKRDRLTLDDLKALETEMLPPAIVVKFVGGDPYALNLNARRNPERVPFPFIVSGKNGTRVKFSRRGLIAWAEGSNRKEVI